MSPPGGWYEWLLVAFIPFLVAERPYGETQDYSFEPIRMVVFPAVPADLMASTRISCRGRVW